MKIEQFVTRIKKGTILLPTFQRGYIWNPPDVVSLMNSLYHEYPVGMVTTWEPLDDEGQLIIDGQQRMSSLFACYTNEVPEIHKDADKKPRTGLYFNVDTQQFKFATRTDLRDPMWVSVSEILNNSAEWRTRVRQSQNYNANKEDEYSERISRVRDIKKLDIPTQDVKPELTPDDIVEIFVRINKQGKTVKRGELEMARICIAWDLGRRRIQEEKQRWSNTPLSKAMNEDAIIRTMTTVHTGRYLRTGLAEAKSADLEKALTLTALANEAMGNALTKRLAIHDTRGIPTVATFPAIARYLSRHDGRFKTAADEAKALAYHLTATGWGVYHGSTDNQIDQDVQAADSDDPWEHLYQNARTKIGEPVADPIRFKINRRGGRFFPIVHVLQMQPNVRDFLTGNPIREYSHDELQQHHIFPRAHLQSRGTDRDDLETIGNIALISGSSNEALKDKPPEIYLRDIDNADSQMLNDHCIPRDPELWKMENYEKFLDKRRALLADATNKLMAKLRNGQLN